MPITAGAKKINTFAELSSCEVDYYFIAFYRKSQAKISNHEKIDKKGQEK